MASEKSLEITCCDCNKQFDHGVKAQLIYQKNGFEMPIRCAGCRADKKARQAKCVYINCAKCECSFAFSLKSQEYYTSRGWSPPIRCFDCRKLNKTEYEEKMALEAVAAAFAATSEAPAPIGALPPAAPTA